MPQKLFGLLAATMLCCATVSAQAAERHCEPSQIKGPARGAANDVMLLGSAHLSQLPASFDPAASPCARLITSKRSLLSRSRERMASAESIPRAGSTTIEGRTPAVYVMPTRTPWSMVCVVSCAWSAADQVIASAARNAAAHDAPVLTAPPGE